MCHAAPCFLPSQILEPNMCQYHPGDPPRHWTGERHSWGRNLCSKSRKTSDLLGFIEKWSLLFTAWWKALYTGLKKKKKPFPLVYCALQSCEFIFVTLFLHQNSGQTDQVEQCNRQKTASTYQEITDKSRLSKSLKISLYRFVSDLECIFFTSEINSIKVKPMNLEDALTLA